MNLYCDCWSSPEDTYASVDPTARRAWARAAEVGREQMEASPDGCFVSDIDDVYVLRTCPKCGKNLASNRWSQRPPNSKQSTPTGPWP